MSAKLSDLNIDITKFNVTKDDGYSFYYTNLDKGIQYVTDVSTEVKYINYIPSLKDNNLRCKGFPAYSPATEIYRPFSTFTMKNMNFNLARMESFLYETKNTPDNLGYIFIYLKKGLSISQSKRHLQIIKNFVYKNQKLLQEQVKIVFGGYRDLSEIEMFLLPKSFSAPSASSKYPIL